MPTFIRPRGSADAIAVNAIAPETTGLNPIDIYDKNISGAVYARFDGSSSIFRCNDIAQYSAAAMTIGTKISQDLNFRTNDSTRWAIGATSTHLLPAAALTSDVGGSSNRCRDFYGRNVDLTGNIAGAPAADFTITPYGGTGSMTFTGTTTSHRRAFPNGKMTNVRFHVSGTVGGTPSYGVTFTLPTQAATNAAGQYFPLVIVIPDGTYEIGYGVIASGGTTCSMQRAGVPPKAFDAGTNVFAVNFWYETV